MMILYKHEHNKGFFIIPDNILKGVRKALEGVNPPINRPTKLLREDILDSFFRIGWSDQIRISTDSKITITSVLHNVGLCLQTGNVSRFYADMLKLQTLYSARKIVGGIYVIPSKHEAKNIGSNIAHFDRFVDELQVFFKIITIPMAVYGFERRI